ncbi:Beta-lactamase class A [Fulvimarina pelagi HTCC2506]|uniref:beta-lactamase n=1 Tax=Fulvimarina pelagi HTCC2506 TaxID=314231 RepID=Q0G4Z1_9HYPH|nr:class A beta-lactamase [Fulvimarina pelagi]EAU43273.1 Beta-lactamase class A [Fulvimarina pelagi HTCC2506]
MQTTFSATAHAIALVALSTGIACVQVGARAPDEVAAKLEDRLETRVGVFVLDTGTGETWEHRADERFPMASTFKSFACSALLDKAAKGSLALDDTVAVEVSDLVTYSPVTEKRVGSRLSLREACEATLRTSDNTAANIVLEALGGPQAVTDFMRSIGDDATRLDRYETALNEARPGDARDTTTPRAAAESLRTLLLDDGLGASDRQLLGNWMRSNEVAGPLLRAGIPDTWIAADRSGAGGFGTRGVTAVLWPPEHAPFVVAAYLTGREIPMESRNEALAEIGRAVAGLVE